MAPKTTVYVKAVPGTNGTALGDCPFSHKVLLTLEEKKVKHERKYIDLQSKPQWFLDAFPAAEVPVLHMDGDWTPDSDAICGLLETKFPKPSLAPRGSDHPGRWVFGAFVDYIRNTDESLESDHKANLLEELKGVNSHLEATGGPFLDGASVTSVDLALYPKFRHCLVACAAFKGLELETADFSHFLRYMESFASRASAQSTFYPDEAIIEGWRPKVGIQVKL